MNRHKKKKKRIQSSEGWPCVNTLVFSVQALHLLCMHWTGTCCEQTQSEKSINSVLYRKCKFVFFFLRCPHSHLRSVCSLLLTLSLVHMFWKNGKEPEHRSRTWWSQMRPKPGHQQFPPGIFPTRCLLCGICGKDSALDDKININANTFTLHEISLCTFCQQHNTWLIAHKTRPCVIYGTYPAIRLCLQLNRCSQVGNAIMTWCTKP